MPVYISMLRGINLGAHHPMKMDKLRESCAALGFTQIQTYIQSGNIVFHAAKLSPVALSRKIENRIMADFGFPVPVITKTTAEMGQTLQNNPFLKQPGIDASKLHVTFLSQAPVEAAIRKLPGVSAGDDAFHHSGDRIYLHCPNGYGETKLSNGFFEKALSVRATTRNWKTVNKLHEMALECA